MKTLLVIGVFINMGPIKISQSKLIGSKMRRHPIQYHPNIILMESVHKEHEILRRSVSA